LVKVFQESLGPQYNVILINGDKTSNRKVQKEANQLIEDFMLLANKSVAEFVSNKGKNTGAKRDQFANAPKKPMVYRIHDRPDPDKLGEFSKFVAQFGYRTNFQNENTISAQLNQLMSDIKGKGEENVIETLAIITMAKAIYSSKNIGHYGLAFKFYTHFFAISQVHFHPTTFFLTSFDNCSFQFYL
jgi:ribonuclease R